MSDAAQGKEMPPTLLQFPSLVDSIESTDRFELDVPPSLEGQTLCFRFFAKAKAADAIPVRDEVRIVLPTGAVLLAEVQPILPSLAVRSLPG